MVENQTLIERLSIFIDSKNVSLREFERQTETGTAVISQAIRNKGSIGSDKLVKIYLKFPELNIKWLLTGKGEMLEGESNEVIPFTPEKPAELRDCEKENAHLQQIINEKEKHIQFLQKLLENTTKNP